MIVGFASRHRWPGPRQPLAGLLVVAALAGTSSAQDRPLRTETARTAAAGALSLEVGLDFASAEPNFLTGRTRDRWDGPGLRLTWSPADRVELDLEWVAWIQVRDDPDFGDASDFGDVTLRAKARLVGAVDSSTTLSARFGVTLPETGFGEGLGPNTLRMSAQFLVTRRVGRGELHANAGLALLDEPLRAHEQRDLLAYGVAAEVPVGRARLVAEVSGLLGDGMPGAEARSEARAGVRVPVRDVAVDAAVRRGLTDADGTWGFTAGLTWRVR